MPDDLFAHPRLAPLYDAFDSDRGDLPAYLEIVEALDPGHVVDVGCGTGTLATLLAGTGRTVTGVDPAAASLHVARAKPTASPVTWLHGGAGELPAVWGARPPADLALMTGNVAQVFLTDDDWAAALRGIHRVLRSGGHLVFEARRPEFRAWREWAADTAPVLRDVPGVGLVERHFGGLHVRLPLVSFRYEFHFHADRTVLTSDSTLRFRSRDEIAESLRTAGFDVLEVRDAPDRPGRENVFLAQRAR
ncbi:class I SAM-dependent methyltransferase [Actinoplanes teichomyceticus]|uniref:Ubiquinone/menaquinone biosynthesis C-methylase UbiE n=1 Tax=Actinoplanes teichomyceticus TaxID=1867 RepID=A0A561VRT5_ACTTI|nr:class I SAM-dependent methyltransferase [Actinoplanes teichomyceticus]TWG14345.1 ubiquinone/menaquinone biosynthesis C-methylase UbiE [Actinoplanes teichomyceticus]GIF13097.1 methyltransferase [Actinoplanes teichomyceticus]